MKQRQWIIDCDPGVDDALAVLAALGNEGVALEVVCTVYGNVPVQQATRNLRKVLQFVAESHRPKLGEGATQPLANSRLPRRALHGKDGLGDLGIETRGFKATVHHGLELMEDCLDKGASRLVALGPLTNVARMFARNPNRLYQLEQLTVLSGIADCDKPSDCEFNLASDLPAAKCLVNPGLPLRWITADIGKTVRITEAMIDSIEGKSKNSGLAKLIARLMRFALSGRSADQLGAMPDAVATALAIDNSLGQWSRKAIVFEEGTRTGRIRFNRQAPTVLVCDAVHSERVREFLLTSWLRALKKAA